MKRTVEVPELFQRHQQMARTAGEAVELPDEHTVELPPSRGGHQRIEPRPPFVATGHGDIAVVADDYQATPLGVAAQPVVLQVRLLISGRDTQVKRGAGTLGHDAVRFRPTRYSFSDRESILPIPLKL
jgi:hypothetical protein